MLVQVVGVGGWLYPFPLVRSFTLHSLPRIVPDTRHPMGPILSHSGDPSLGKGLSEPSSLFSASIFLQCSTASSVLNCASSASSQLRQGII